MIATRLAVAVAFTAIHATAAGAQPASAIPGRLELAAGLLWTGGQPLGSQDANLTTGTGSTLRLFSSTTDVHAATGFEGRIAVKLTRAFEAQALMSYAKPIVTTRVNNDTENSVPGSASESLQQYTVGAGLTWYAPRNKSIVRLRPFLAVDVAYLRQLHEGATLVATGQSYDAGGGIKVLLASRARKRMKAAGVRFDARILVRRNGVAFDGRRSIGPAGAASWFVRF